jgi:hypothetical protein
LSPFDVGAPRLDPTQVEVDRGSDQAQEQGRQGQSEDYLEQCKRRDSVMRAGAVPRGVSGSSNHPPPPPVPVEVPVPDPVLEPVPPPVVEVVVVVACAASSCAINSSC